MIRRFNRYELKYIVDARSYRRICDDLTNFMRPDTYGDVDGFYRVTSLYYDSPQLSAYWSKIDGLRFRRKLRLRIYPGTGIRNVDTGFVEIKQRINRTVQKKRVALPLAQAMRLCGDAEVPHDLDAVDTAVAEEMAYMVRVLQLKPKAIVSYRRRAFIGGAYERGMRLTFDMQLQGRTTALEVNRVAKNYFFLPPDYLIMEVKVNERIPAWMVSLLAQHRCQLQRVSKYCAVMASGMSRLKNGFLYHKENLYG
jgi:hypothetical protein